jgi:hypothetical protein
MNIVNVFEKQPRESYVIGIEWAGKLPTNAYLISGTVGGQIYPSMDEDNSIITNTLATVSGTQSLTKVLGGEPGRDYRITFLMTLNTGDILEEDVVMQVREL